MAQVTAIGSAGAINNVGVFNNFTFSPLMNLLSATGSGGTTSYGVENFDSTSAPVIRNSVLAGDTDGMRLNGSTNSQLINTQVSGGIDAAPAGTQCRNAFNGAFAAIAC